MPDKKIAKVVLDIALDKSFDYLVPEELKTQIEEGSRVSVPFGRATQQGFVVAFARKSEFEKLKSIKQVDQPVLCPELLKLGHWISKYWLHPLGQVLAAMSPACIRKYKKPLEKILEKENFAQDTLPQQGPSLTAEQKTALEKITPTLTENKFRVFLLHGVTGSGKTEVYLRAIEECVKQDRQAVFILPEISLTPQMETRFESRFPGRISIFHSRLTEKQRRISWARFAQGQSTVAIGARSVVFARSKNLGLLIVDEEHERSFKQDDGLRYHARDVAVMRAKFANVPVILGSATPSVESYENCRKKKYTLLEMTKRAADFKQPEITIVDMETERDIRKTSGLFCKRLVNHIEENLKKNEQTLLFLNRRGFSTICQCEGCGWDMTCMHCSVALTYHKVYDRAYCHICGYNAQIPAKCPECGSKKLNLQGMGTQRIESVCRKMFPAARIRRIDTDSMKAAGAFAQLYEDVLEHKIDILVGTQMLAKGLHFPNLTLAGIINADTALQIPDFRATELTFQTILQVAGRVGRGEKPGKVIVQTQSLDENMISCILKNDYNGFADNELETRRELNYPPFDHFVRIVFTGKNETAVIALAEKFYALSKSTLSKHTTHTTITTPTPASMAKKRDNFRWHILVKGPRVFAINSCLRAVAGHIENKKNIRISIDVDPYSML